MAEVKEVVEAKAVENEKVEEATGAEEAKKATLFEKHPGAKLATVIGGVAVIGITGAYFIHKIAAGQATLEDAVKANKYAINAIKDQLADLPNKFVEKAPEIAEQATETVSQIAEPVFDSAAETVVNQ